MIESLLANKQQNIDVFEWTFRRWSSWSENACLLFVIQLSTFNSSLFIVRRNTHVARIADTQCIIVQWWRCRIPQALLRRRYDLAGMLSYYLLFNRTFNRLKNESQGQPLPEEMPIFFLLKKLLNICMVSRFGRASQFYICRRKCFISEFRA